MGDRSSPMTSPIRLEEEVEEKVEWVGAEEKGC